MAIESQNEFNPYQAPQAEVGGPSSAEEGAPPGQPTQAMIEHLKGTSPWALFLAVVGFVSCAFMGLSGLISLVMIPVMAASSGEAPVTEIVGGVAFFYIGGAAAYGVGAWYLVRYHLAIGRATKEPSFASVEEALVAQQRFWKITTVITLAFVALVILFSVIIAVTIAARGGMA